MNHARRGCTVTASASYNGAPSIQLLLIMTDGRGIADCLGRRKSSFTTCQTIWREHCTRSSVPYACACAITAGRQRADTHAADPLQQLVLNEHHRMVRVLTRTAVAPVKRRWGNIMRILWESPHRPHAFQKFKPLFTLYSIECVERMRPAGRPVAVSLTHTWRYLTACMV